MLLYFLLLSGQERGKESQKEGRYQILRQVQILVGSSSSRFPCGKAKKAAKRALKAKRDLYERSGGLN